VGAKSKIHKTAKMIEPYFIDEECEVGENVELGPNVILCKSVKIEAGTKLNNAIIHRRTKIGQKCVLENCVVSDNNTIGENAKIGQLAIVAPNCEIGANTKIFDGARVGPNLTIAENSKIQDFIFPTLPQLKAKKKTPDGLTPTELEIYLNLQTAGEQTLASLANLVNISQAELQQHLDSLISKKLIVVYGGETKMVGLVG
jgi:carbonic anhydrase/acetyltransferase-like protein (isoleucine patch superfamily)